MINGNLFRSALLAMIAAHIVAAKTHAVPTVYLTMVSGGGTWQLYADASLGDNPGIASFNIPLLNVATLAHEGPFYEANSVDGQPAGFSEFRSTTNNTLFASQKVVPTPTTHIVYEFGQSGGTLPGPGFAGASKNTSYDAHLLLGSGTYTTGTPAVIFGTSDLAINVFRTTGPPTGTMAATVVPEPASISLLGFAAVALLMRPCRSRHQ